MYVVTNRDYTEQTSLRKYMLCTVHMNTKHIRPFQNIPRHFTQVDDRSCWF